MSTNLQTFAKTQGLTLATAQYEMFKQSGEIAQIFLVNGICLKSVIIDYNDDYLLMLDRNGQPNLVSRKAVSTSSGTGRTDEQFGIDLSGDKLEIFALKQLSDFVVNVFLLNGVRLTGKIEAFDENAIFLSAFDKETERATNQIVQFSSIASVSKMTPKTFDKGGRGGNY